MKEKILEAALEQFMKQGVRDISIQKLIAPLGISTKTVYKYFENKEELLEQALLLFQNQRYDKFNKLRESHHTIALFIDIWYLGLEREYNVNNKFFYDLHYYYPELEAKINAHIASTYWEEFRQIFIQGQKEDVFVREINPNMALETVGFLYESIARTDRFAQFNSSILDIFSNTIMPYIKGLCTKEGIKQVEDYMKISIK
jgi:AcrR family transcriptional regulator